MNNRCYLHYIIILWVCEFLCCDEEMAAENEEMAAENEKKALYFEVFYKIKLFLFIFVCIDIFNRLLYEIYHYYYNHILKLISLLLSYKKYI